MSDILDRAEATVRAMDAVPPGQIDIQVARKDRERLYHIIKLAHEAEMLLPELIAEIKRQKAHSATVLSHCGHLKMSIETLEAEIKRLREDNRLLRQQAIPTDPTDAQMAAIKWQNSMNVWRQRYEQQAAYVARLEAAYLRAAEGFYRYQAMFPEEIAKQRARDALERIRGEQG
jgi:DNA repair exonuclease SbcCD ATPase subunit